MASTKEVHLRALSTFGLPLPLGHTSRSSSHWKPQGNASPPSGMGPWVPRECWHRSYARNPLFALPSLLQGGRAFRDPLLGSAGTAGSLFSSRCSQEWSRGSSAGANFRPPNIADVPLSSYLCAVLPCKSPVYQGVKVLQGHSVLGIRKNFEFLTYLKCLSQILSLSDVGVTLLFFFFGLVPGTLWTLLCGCPRIACLQTISFPAFACQKLGIPLVHSSRFLSPWMDAPSTKRSFP